MIAQTLKFKEEKYYPIAVTFVVIFIIMLPRIPLDWAMAD